MTLGLTPKPHSSGGKERLGKISKMGNRTIRRLLYLGAMGVTAARRHRPAGDDWLWQLLDRKPVKLAAIALANRIARPQPLSRTSGVRGFDLGLNQVRRKLSGGAGLNKKHRSIRNDRPPEMARCSVR